MYRETCREGQNTTKADFYVDPGHFSQGCLEVEIFEHKEVTVKPVAKAKPQLKPPVTLSLVSILIRERKRIDIDTQPFDQDCFAVSQAMEQYDSTIL